MSYILDALKKSEQERQPHHASPPRGAVHNISIPLPSAAWLFALAAILLLAIVAVALFFWRGTVNSIPILPPAVSTTPVTDLPTQPVAKTTPPPPRVIENTAPVRDLADEAHVPIAVIRTPSVKRPRSQVATPARSRSGENVLSTPLVSDHTPLLQQMPLEFQRALPSMAVTIHVYSHDASQCILFINNREYHQGDRIEGGIRVEEIVPDGVVLSLQGERFKLARPR